MRFGRLGVATAALLLVVTASANAATITFNSRAAFDAATSATTIEDFESFGVELPFHTVTVDFGDFTASMTGSPSTSYNFLDIAPSVTSESDVNGTNDLRVFTNTGQTLVFTFDTAITAFGADFRNLNDTAHRTDIVAAGVTMTPPTVALGSATFYGFTSDTPFTTVTFTGLLNDVYGIDNVTFGQVPEPTSVLLLGAGSLLLGLGTARRRRRKSAV